MRKGRTQDLQPGYASNIYMKRVLVLHEFWAPVLDQHLPWIETHEFAAYFVAVGSFYNKTQDHIATIFMISICLSEWWAKRKPDAHFATAVHHPHATQLMFSLKRSKQVSVSIHRVILEAYPLIVIPSASAWMATTSAGKLVALWLWHRCLVLGSYLYVWKLLLALARNMFVLEMIRAFWKHRIWIGI